MYFWGPKLGSLIPMWCIDQTEVWRMTKNISEIKLKAFVNWWDDESYGKSWLTYQSIYWTICLAVTTLALNHYISQLSNESQSRVKCRSSANYSISTDIYILVIINRDTGCWSVKYWMNIGCLECWLTNDRHINMLIQAPHKIQDSSDACMLHVSL